MINPFLLWTFMLSQCHKKIVSFIQDPRIAGMKLILVFFVSIVILWVHTIYSLLVIASCNLFILLCSGIRWERLRPFLVTSIITAFFVLTMHFLSNTLRLGLVVALQFSIITLTSCFLVCTTSELDIVYAADKFLHPLKKLGFNTHIVSFALFFTMRSIAIIYFQYQQIRCVQKARGLQNNPIAIMVPLLIKLFHSANSITDALVARAAFLMIEDESK